MKSFSPARRCWRIERLRVLGVRLVVAAELGVSPAAAALVGGAVLVPEQHKRHALAAHFDVNPRVVGLEHAADSGVATEQPGFERSFVEVGHRLPVEPGRAGQAQVFGGCALGNGEALGDAFMRERSLVRGSILPTNMIGNVTDLSTELGNSLFWSPTGMPPPEVERAHRERLHRAAGLISMFIIGGFVGVAGFEFLGFVCVVPLAAVLLGVSVPPIVRDMPRSASLRHLLGHVGWRIERS